MGKKKEVQTVTIEDVKALALSPKEVSKFQKLSITTKEQGDKVSVLIRERKDNLKEIKKKGDSVLKPLNEAVKNMKAIIAEAMEQDNLALEILEGKQKEYLKLVAQQAAKEAEKLQKKEDRKAEKLSDKLGVEVTPVTVKAERATAGGSKLVDDWKARIVNEALVPDEYKIVSFDMPKLNGLAKVYKDKLSIAGVEAYNDPYLRTD